jgi:N-acyl homoserine lactone hydrolase
VHVIDHPDARVLVNTGMTELHPALADMDARLRPLSKQDFDLAGIDIVVNTHLHGDHCGGNHLFAGRPIYVQRRELEDAREDDYTIREWVEAPGVRYVSVDGELELLPGLRLVPAPGHTRGMQVVVVQAGGRPVVVGGDVAVRFGELDEPHTEGQLRCVRSTPSWSGSRTSTSHGDPVPSEASRRRSRSRGVACNESLVEEDDNDGARNSGGPRAVPDHKDRYSPRAPLQGTAGRSFIEPGSPWQNPFRGVVRSRVRDEVLSVEAFDSVEA